MLCESNLKIKISISVERTNNNLNEDFNILLNKSSNQIEDKDDDFTILVIKRLVSYNFLIFYFTSICT